MSELTDTFFTDTVNVYRSRRRTTGGDMGYHPTPVVSALPCSLQSTENVDKNRGPMGLKKEDNIFTLDVIYCGVSADIRGQDVIKVTTSGHPEENSYFQIMGDKDARPDRFGMDLGYAKVYINKITTPSFLDAGS